MKPIHFIINPLSGNGKTLKTWAAARASLASRRIDFVERVTRRAGEATEIARGALESGVERVVAVGGDGTLNEVLNGYLTSSGEPVNRSAAIGLIPSGTGSDFRKTMGFVDWRDAVTACAGGRTREIDAARVRFKDAQGESASRFFINLASFGLGGDVAELVNRWRDRWPLWLGGHARFAAAAVCALNRYRNVAVKITLDGESEYAIETNLLIVANGRFAGGGMMLAPHAELDDGLLDVVLTDGATRLDVIRELPRIQRGGYLKNPKVTELRAREVLIDTAAPLRIDIDGDMAGSTPAAIVALPRALRFLA
ncbi:MAG TPA: diacylglycerol kinase family protein [Blastocatellia bacterium]|nr:diacylglycerol kinase family protein [Blastocatellia bacterium]